MGLDDFIELTSSRSYRLWDKLHQECLFIYYVNSCNPADGDIDHNVARTGVHPGFRGIHIKTLCKMANFRTKSEWLHLID